jgi:hypothetical protein
MARKAPNFGGFTLEDIAKANIGNDNAKNSIAKETPQKEDKAVSSRTKKSKSQNSIAENNITAGENAVTSQKINSNANIDNAINSIAENNITKREGSSIRQKEDSNAITNIAIKDMAKNVNQALFSRVREHLYKLLGDDESVEIKLNEVIKDLNINPHSFYKYLRTLRETDFTVVKLRYSTEIKRRV